MTDRVNRPYGAMRLPGPGAAVPRKVAVARDNARIERALVELRRLIPGAVVWFGEYTGSWWAFLPGRPFVEADTAAGLAQALMVAMAESSGGVLGRTAQGPETADLIRPRYPREELAPRPVGARGPGRVSGGAVASAAGHRMPRSGLRGRLAALGQAIVGGLVVRT